MNPFGVFASTANQAQNGFYNPTSVSHVQPGWGVDPSLLTPSYDAPYRPKFNGPSPYAAYANPTMIGAASQIFNPFVRDPYWGNPVDHQKGAVNSLSSKPFDAAAEVGQRFVAPAIAYGLSSKIMMGSSMMGMFTGGGLGGGAGKSLGLGVARGIGMGSGAASIMGGVGSVLGATTGMMLGGQFLMKGAEMGFQAYSRTRQMSEDLSNNFANLTFNDAAGHSVTGRGLGRTEAARMATKMDKIGTQDMTWSAAQFGAIGDMSSKAGLLDGTNSKQMIDKMKGISEQIKMIVAISKDPSIQGAIEEIAKLKSGGASINGGNSSVAASTYRSLGHYASMAGTSVQKMMSTVGTQGQYMFQMNGITPYLGQLAAGSAYSGFSAAHRTGVLSDAQMARMGGAEGATQSVLSAQMTSLQTPYNRMVQANKYLFGGNGRGGVQNNINNFSANFSKNPSENIGKMGLYGDAMNSRQTAEEGSMQIEKHAMDIIKMRNLQPGANGKYDPAELYNALTMSNMSKSDIMAFIQLRRGETSKEVVDNKLKSIKAQSAETLRQTAIQDVSSDSMGASINRAWSKVYKNVDRVISMPGQGWNELEANVHGVWESVADRWSFGKTFGKADQSKKYAGAAEGNETLYNEIAGKAEKSTGIRGELVDNLDLLGEADKIRRGYSSESGLSMKDYLVKSLKDPEYKDLKKAMGSTPSNELEKKITEMSNSAMQFGLTGPASIAASMDMKVDDVMKDPEKYISDPAVLKKIKEAGGDKKKISRYIAQSLEQRSGGSLVGTSISSAGSMNNQSYSNMSAGIISEYTRTNDVYESSKSMIDYDEFDRVTKSLDQNLNSAATNINEAAKNLNDATGGGNKPKINTWVDLWKETRKSLGK